MLLVSVAVFFSVMCTSLFLNTNLVEDTQQDSMCTPRNESFALKMHRLALSHYLVEKRHLSSLVPMVLKLVN